MTWVPTVERIREINMVDTYITTVENQAYFKSRIYSKTVIEAQYFRKKWETSDVIYITTYKNFKNNNVHKTIHVSQTYIQSKGHLQN